MSERASDVGKTIDQGDLESLLDVEYERDEERKRVILPADRWSHVNERVDSVRSTRLMIASRDGARECVNLLLRCGADVNARDRHKRKAIDYSVDGNHLEVTLMLLQWDSLLPYEMETEKSGELKSRICENDDIMQFFTKRDEFHKILKDVNPESLEEMLKAVDGNPRYWVNSNGESALYTAAMRWNYDAWALLRSSGFLYATNDEKKEMEVLEDDDAFIRAIGRHFVEIRGCHVQKMVAKSKVYRREGVDEDTCGEKVDGYFREIDSVECTSDLLQSLQDDPSLEIVFDFSSSDIQCIRPSGESGKVWGLTDSEVNRIYVGALETEGFEYSDVVSNLVHEIAHKTMAVVFENGGLPYRMEDVDSKEDYENVVRKVSSNENKKHFDKIIQRALKPRHLVNYELIVRVPEMIVKYKNQGTGMNGIEDGFSRLKEEAPDLLEFYERCVVPEIRDYIERSKTANKAVKSNLLRTTAMLTSHNKKRIQVNGSIEKACTSKHNKLRVFKVSNLKLGVSHLKLSLEDVTFVDWTKYQSAREYFKYALDRSEIKTMAIVWDEVKEPTFCRRSNSSCSSNNCIAKKIANIVDRAMMVVPKKFPVALDEEKSFCYLWKHLSKRTKMWILEKKLKFRGEGMTLREIVACTSRNEELEYVLDRLLDAVDLSTLIDQGNVEIGRSLNSLLREREVELLRKYPECYIPRSLRVRRVEFTKAVFNARMNDAFIVMNAEKSDLERVGIKEACAWDGNNVPAGIRCFKLMGGRHQENGDDMFLLIFKKLNELSCQKSKGVNWDFIHFFELKEDIYIHLHSIKCGVLSKSTTQEDIFQYSGVRILGCRDFGSTLIVADSPGSGKTVFVNETASLMMEESRKRWVDVVELTIFENVFKQWNETDFTSEEKVTDCLYELIKSGGSDLERKIFDHFCKTGMNFVIFFDGFDEICPSYKEIFTSFLEAVVSRERVKVCITTRTHESADLEKRLATLAFNLVPFSAVDQVKFINGHWNASLKSIPSEERETKIQDIVCNLESHNDLAGKGEILKHIRSLTMVEGGSSVLNEVNFVELATELMKAGISTVEGEGELTSTPLHTWMLASVSFEDNFNFKKFNNLSGLYQQFIEIKISLYCREKAKASEHQSADSMLAGFKKSTYDSLRRFSAYYFLQDEDCKLNQDETHEMLRVGLLSQRDQSTAFVHRTFGEYFLSTWLLEKAHEVGVTRVWVSLALLGYEFEKVRQFLDGFLISEYEKRSAGHGKKTVAFGKYLLNPSAFPDGEQFVKSLQNGVYKCILERNRGILLYLAENSKAKFADLMFEETDLDVRSLGVKLERRREKTTYWNALTLFGSCIGSGVSMTKSNITRSGMEYLKVLPSMLRLIEDQGLIKNFKEFMLRCGLWWTGVDRSHLWQKEGGIAQFKYLFEFLSENDILDETMKAGLLDEERELLLVNSAVYSFDLFVYILESIVEEGELKETVVLRGNLVRAWTSVVQDCSLEGVTTMWDYMEGKLETVEDKRRFLLRKDHENGTALCTAFCNSLDPNVVSFVWGLLRKEFDRRECKDILFSTFDGVKEKAADFIKYEFFKWLAELLEVGFLDGEEASRLLLSRDDEDEYYMLEFYGTPSPPSSLYQLQELILTGRLASKDILRKVTGHYQSISRSCFADSKWIRTDADFASVVQREWDGLIPSLETSPLWNAIHLDGDGFLQHVLQKDNEKIHAVQLIAYLVLLQRQCRVEEETLGGAGLLERVQGEWWGIYFFFRQLRRGDGVRLSREFFVPLFFAVLSKFLPKEQVADLLLHHNRHYGSAFHFALVGGENPLLKEDPGLFLAYYDIARWSMGENALWRVHAIGRGGEREKRTVLDLLKKQDEGILQSLKL